MAGGRGTKHTDAHDEPPPDKQAKKRYVSIAMAASSYSNSRHNDKDQFDSIEAGAAKTIGKVAKEHLSDDGSKKGEEVDEKASPFPSMRPIYKGNRSKNDVGRE